MIELESMAMEMPVVEGHPNRTGFRGVLTVVDVASTRAPSGSGGRRVILTKAAAEAALPSLMGMALDYAPAFDRHDVRQKVGVITSAEIVGRNVEISGHLYAKDFPEVVEEIGKVGAGRAGRAKSEFPTLAAKGVARMGHPSRFGVNHPVSNGGEGAELRSSLAYAVERLRDLTGMRRVPGETAVSELHAETLEAGAGSGLGMSYEVANAIVADRRARVWTLTRVTFTGAAILRRNKAAYEETWIELA